MSLASRRAFLQALGSAALLPGATVTPDLVLHNANIMTVNRGQPRAQAVAIGGGRFLAVGSNGGSFAPRLGATKKIDLAARRWFRVSSTHTRTRSIPAFGIFAGPIGDRRSIREIQQTIREKAAKTPEGEWWWASHTTTRKPPKGGS